MIMPGKSWLWLIALGAMVVAVLAVLMPLNRQDAIARSMGKNCKAIERCEGVLHVSCRPEVDGPSYYVDFPTGDVISTCGGACRLPDRDECNSLCPPPEWTCDKEESKESL